MDALLHMHFFCYEDKIIHKYDTNLQTFIKDTNSRRKFKQRFILIREEKYIKNINSKKQGK